MAKQSHPYKSKENIHSSKLEEPSLLMFLLTCGARIWILFLKICLEVPYPKRFLISIKGIGHIP